MSTIVGLNNNFFAAIDAAIGSLPADKQDPLKKVYSADREKIEALAKQDNSARGPIMRLLKEGVPKPEQVEEIKKGFEERHKELIKELTKVHEKQLEAFEEAVEKANLPSTEQFKLLAQVKNAQQAQLNGLKERAENDQHRLENITDVTIQRDQKFAFYMLDRAANQDKAITEYYRPPGGKSVISMIGMIKDKLGYPTDPTIGEVGEVEIKKARKFSVTDVEFESETPGGEKRWRAKDKKNTLGGTEIRSGRKKSTGEEVSEDWPMITKDYLAGIKNDQLVIEDFGAAGVFRGRGPVRLMQGLGILAAQPLVIELNARILEDKEKGIEAANGVIRCKMPIGASKEQKIAVLNVLAQVYMAKGWEGVELGYQTPQELWEEAYIACRRAGFSHDQIRFRGELMANKDAILRGDKARGRLEEAFKEKENRLGEPKIDEAMAKLANVIYNPDLSRETFFAVENPDERLELFQQGSLDQQAEIIADYAFNEAALPKYMKAVAGEAMAVEKLATVLDGVAERNPDRLLAAFEAIGDREDDQAEKGQKVFNTLSTEAQAQLLTQLPSKEEATAFFKGLPKPATPDAENPKFHLLADPNLSNAVIYGLYDSLSEGAQHGEKYSEQQQALNYLAQNPVSNKKALGAIVAGSFLAKRDKNVRSMEWDIKEFTRILSKQKEDDANTIMGAVYEAFPANLKDIFQQRLQAYETTTGESTRDLRDLYEKNKGKEVEGAHSLTSAETADVLRQDSAKSRAYKLEALVVDANDDIKKNKLAKIAVQLGLELVGKALAGFENSNNIQAFVKTIQQTGGQPNNKFLANVLSVYYNNAEIKNKEAFKFNGLNVAAILPYVNHPNLIKSLVEGLGGDPLINCIKALSNDKTQQANVFKQLSSDQQLNIMFAESVTLAQKSMLFACLKKSDQIVYVQKCPAMNNQTVGANHLIACWKNAYLTGNRYDQDAFPFDALIKHSSQTNALFLTHLFSDVQNNPAELFQRIMTLDQRFNGILPQEKKTEAINAYLMTVGQAIAALDKPKQQALFVGELNSVKSTEAATAVRAYALIDLMARGERETARALLGHPDLAQNVRDPLKNKIRDLADGFSSAPDFQKSLDKLVGHNRQPVVEQQNRQPVVQRPQQ